MKDFLSGKSTSELHDSVRPGSRNIKKSRENWAWRKNVSQNKKKTYENSSSSYDFLSRKANRFQNYKSFASLYVKKLQRNDNNSSSLKTPQFQNFFKLTISKLYKTAEVAFSRCLNVYSSYAFDCLKTAVKEQHGQDKVVSHFCWSYGRTDKKIWSKDHTLRISSHRYDVLLEIPCMTVKRSSQLASLLTNNYCVLDTSVTLKW